MRNEKGQFIKGHASALPANFSDHMKKISKERGYGKWNLGRKLSDEHRKAIAKGNTGKKLSKETLKKMVNTRIMNGGYEMSNETKEKLRLANIGRKISPETRKKLSISLKGKNKGEKNGMWNGGSS